MSDTIDIDGLEDTTDVVPYVPMLDTDYKRAVDRVSGPRARRHRGLRIAVAIGLVVAAVGAAAGYAAHVYAERCSAHNQAVERQYDGAASNLKQFDDIALTVSSMKLDDVVSNIKNIDKNVDAIRKYEGDADSKYADGTSPDWDSILDSYAKDRKALQDGQISNWESEVDAFAKKDVTQTDDIDSLARDISSLSSILGEVNKKDSQALVFDGADASKDLVTSISDEIGRYQDRIDAIAKERSDAAAKAAQDAADEAAAQQQAEQQQQQQAEQRQPARQPQQEPQSQDDVGAQDVVVSDQQAQEPAAGGVSDESVAVIDGTAE